MALTTAEEIRIKALEIAMRLIPYDDQSYTATELVAEAAVIENYLRE